MKNRPLLHIMWIATTLALVACTSPNEEPIRSKTNMSALVGSPYYTLLDRSVEVFGKYWYTDMHLFLDAPEEHYISRNNEPNTYYIDLQHLHTFTISDNCEITSDSTESDFLLDRTFIFNSGQDSASYSYTSHFEPKDPITFIRPYSTKHDPMPLCYYQNMEIAWNTDDHNTNGVVIVVEWQGGCAFAPTRDVQIVNASLVTDNGQTVLSNSMFDDMPNGALVNIWLLRADVDDFSPNNSIQAEDNLINIVKALDYEDKEKDEIFTIINNHPLPKAVCGSVALLPIVLIRNLPNE